MVRNPELTSDNKKMTQKPVSPWQQTNQVPGNQGKINRIYKTVNGRNALYAINYDRMGLYRTNNTLLIQCSEIERMYDIPMTGITKNPIAAWVRIKKPLQKVILVYYRSYMPDRPLIEKLNLTDTCINSHLKGRTYREHAPFGRVVHQGRHRRRRPHLGHHLLDG